MSLPTSERLSEIIGSIYDCILAPNHWATALGQIVNQYDFDNSAITVHDLATSKLTLHVAVGVDEEWHRYAQIYGAEVLSIWGGPERIAGFPMEEPIIQSEATPRHTWTTNAWFIHGIEPRGLHDCAAIKLVNDSKTLGAIAFGQHKKDGEISERSMEALRLLAPHLRRAVVIGRLFEQEAVAAATFSDVLEGVAAGIVLVGDDMEIVHANAAAQRMLAKGDPVQSRGGKLILQNPITNSVLVNAVAQAALKEENLERRSIDIPARRADGTPTVLQVLPLRRRSIATRGMEQRAAAAVFISNAADPPRLPADAMSLLYDLTPAEGRVFELIVEGKAPADIAKQLGVSLPTVKTHLSRVFEKTGCARQADLVAMASKVTLII